jgi:anti-sigma regulatory factor (Ser/Thr protein kinase)
MTDEQLGQRRGAYCTPRGAIYLRISGLDDSFTVVWTDHGISIEDAIMIRDRLDAAISEAAAYRVNSSTRG